MNTDITLELKSFSNHSNGIMLHPEKEKSVFNIASENVYFFMQQIL